MNTKQRLLSNDTIIYIQWSLRRTFRHLLYNANDLSTALWRHVRVWERAGCSAAAARSCRCSAYGALESDCRWCLTLTLQTFDFNDRHRMHRPPGKILRAIWILFRILSFIFTVLLVNVFVLWVVRMLRLEIFRCSLETVCVEVKVSETLQFLALVRLRQISTTFRTYYMRADVLFKCEHRLSCVYSSHRVNAFGLSVLDIITTAAVHLKLMNQLFFSVFMCRDKQSPSWLQVFSLWDYLPQCWANMKSHEMLYVQRHTPWWHMKVSLMDTLLILDLKYGFKIIVYSEITIWP